MFSKRFHVYLLRFCLSVLLIVSLITMSCVPIFATNSTPSALKVSKISPLNSVTLADSSPTNVFINGYTSGRTPWAYLSYNDSLDYFYNTPSTLPDLFSHLANSIARSFQMINSHVRAIEDDVDTIRSKSNNIDSSLSNIYTILTSIKSSIDDIATSSDISNAASSIVQAIENSGISIPQSLLDNVDSINTKLHNDPNNNFTSSYIWGKRLTGSSTILWSDGRSKLNQNWNFGSYSVLANLDYRFQLFQNSMVNMLYNIVGSIGSYSLTNNDLSKTALGSNSSIANDIRNIGSNLSEPLHRLAFVLANDNDIQARQDAAETTQTAINSFIKPSGSASVSGSDVGTLADIGSNVIGNINTGVNASDSLSVFDESSESWSWFTLDTANAFDSTGDNRVNNSLRSKSTSETPYLDAYYAEVMDHVR